MAAVSSGSQFPIGGWVWELARVPGTTSLLGVGSKAAARLPADAVVWAYGKL